jgi:hypothetical protein
MTNPPSAQEALLEEFAAYYNADELPYFLPHGLDEQVDDSAARMVHILGTGAAAVAVLIREMAADPAHPLHQTIEIQTMYGWNGDPESWQTFQQIADRMAGDIDAATSGAGSA